MDALEAVEAEFPGWHAWRGVNGLLYARRSRSSPAVVVRGKSLTVLRIRIAVKQCELDSGSHRPPSDEEGQNP
jgi:hypothetical protein